MVEGQIDLNRSDGETFLYLFSKEEKNSHLFSIWFFYADLWFVV